MLEAAVVVPVLYVVVFLVTPIQLVWRPQALVPLAAIVVGSVGYSLIEGSLTLPWKRVELIHELATGMLIFFSGALLPLDRLPAWMADIGRFTHWARRDRAQSCADRRSVSIAYLVAGIAVFSLGEWLARRQGSLGRY